MSEQTEPAVRQIDSWPVAEQNAAVWMRYWGYDDARVTPAGADKGIDVRARGALAQVKFEAQNVGRQLIQQLVGARGHGQQRLFFFSGSDYAKTALEYADEMNVALFKYDLLGRQKAMNNEARAVLREVRQREEERVERAAFGTSDNGDSQDPIERAMNAPWPPSQPRPPRPKPTPAPPSSAHPTAMPLSFYDEFNPPGGKPIPRYDPNFDASKVKLPKKPWEQRSRFERWWPVPVGVFLAVLSLPIAISAAQDETLDTPIRSAMIIFFMFFGGGAGWAGYTIYRNDKMGDNPFRRS